MIRNRLLRTLTRVSMVCLFPPSALDKVYNRRQAMKQAGSGPLPDPGLLLDIGIAVELIAPALIVAEKRDREAAVVLAGFCAATALLYHRFWEFPDLLEKDSKSEGREHLWEFLKNFGLVGGLMTVTLDRASTTAAASPKVTSWSENRARRATAVTPRPSDKRFR